MTKVISFPSGDKIKTRPSIKGIKSRIKRLAPKFSNFKYKRLYATGRKFIHWTDVKSHIKVDNVTYLFYVNLFGKRSYEYVSTGTADSFKSYRDYLGDVQIWIKGGPLPSWAGDPTRTLWTNVDMANDIAQRTPVKIPESDSGKKLTVHHIHTTEEKT